jgi:transposase-like protein
VIRLAVLMYVRFQLNLRNVEDLLFERGIDICHETVRLPGRANDGGRFPPHANLVRQPSGL